MSKIAERASQDVGGLFAKSACAPCCSPSVVVDADPRVDGPVKVIPTVRVVETKQVEDVVVVGQIPVSHPLNGIGSAKHFVVNIPFAREARHRSDFVFQQVRLEHTSEVVLVLHRVPFKHATGEHTVTVFVVADDLVDTGDTTGDTASGRFNNLLEDGKIEVVEKPNGDVDRVARCLLYTSPSPRDIR